MKKWRVKLLLIASLIMLLLGGELFISSIHSQNAADEYKARLRADGEKLNVAELIPPPVNPESNGVEFFNQIGPLLGSGMLESNDPPVMRMVSPGKAMIGWQQAEIICLYDDFATNSWQDLDDALAPRAYALELLRKAVSRPAIDFEEDYQTVPEAVHVEPLIKMKAAALVLSPAVLADLHHGETAAAVTNLHTLLRLVDLWRDPASIAELSRISMESLACAVQWEVLQASNVTDPELALLQKDWETMDFARTSEKTLIRERDFRLVEIQHLRASNSPTETTANWFSPAGGSTAIASSWFDDLGRNLRREAADTIWRSIWSYDDELRALEADQAMLDALRRVNRDGRFKEALAELDVKFNTIGIRGTNISWLRNHLDIEIWSKIKESTDLSYREIDRVLAAEVARKINITAIALTRYKLRHGAFPPDLPALVPQYLLEVPSDPVDGKPLRFRPNTDGTFMLYSIGSDGIDGGGDVTPGKTNFRTLYWLAARDWVWPQPATRVELQNYYDHPPK